MTKVLNEVTLEVPQGCGSTDGYLIQNHQVGYQRNMMEAQDALRLLINTPQDLTAVLAQGGIIRAIGRGIGNMAKGTAKGEGVRRGEGDAKGEGDWAKDAKASEGERRAKGRRGHP